MAVSVHVARGERGIAVIDSGIAQAYGALLAMLADIHVDVTCVTILLNTHEHMDHLGNNGAIVEASHCLIAAHPSRAKLVADPDRNATAFVRRFPDVEPAFDVDLEYRSLIGPRGAPVSLELVEGVRLDLGGVELEALELPGHTPAELGFIDRQSRALVTGDALAPAWLPTLYLYEDPGQIRESLRRIIDLIASRPIDTVMSGHADPMTPEQAVEIAEACLIDVDRIESAVVEAAERATSTLGQLRDRVTTALGKEREWRALITIDGHLRDLVARGELDTDGRAWWSADPRPTHRLQGELV